MLPCVLCLQALVYDGCIVEIVAQRSHVEYLVTNPPDAEPVVPLNNTEAANSNSEHSLESCLQPTCR